VLSHTRHDDRTKCTRVGNRNLVLGIVPGKVINAQQP
jgi:hypothetical protein